MMLFWCVWAGVGAGSLYRIRAGWLAGWPVQTVVRELTVLGLLLAVFAVLAAVIRVTA